MSACPRCGKTVYFAERKSSMGKEWHPACLKCVDCSKTLTPGSHAEHGGQPYCTQCYKNKFGTEGYGRGGTSGDKAVYGTKK